LVLQARRQLNREVNQCDFYSIICDEATDISKTEQMTFVIRSCDDCYNPKEDFIGLKPCDGGVTAEALLENVKDIMLRCGMEEKKIVAATFDGASAMKALGRLIKENVSPNALYIHCLSHCNELVMKDATKNSRIISDAQTLCEQMYAIAGVSPKRVLLFQKIQQEQSEEILKRPDTYVLRNLSQTRWTTRGPAAEVMIRKHAELLKVLESLSADSTVKSECRAKARGLLYKITSATEMFGVIVFFALVSIMEDNSKLLQSSTLTAEDAMETIQRIEFRLQSLRCDEEYDKFVNELQTLNLPTGMEESEALPRKRKITQKTMSDFITVENIPAAARIEEQTSKDATLRRLYFEAIDALLSSVTSRFQQEDIKVINSIERIILGHINDSETAGTLMLKNTEFL